MAEEKDEPMNADRQHDYDMCPSCRQMVDLSRSPRCPKMRKYCRGALLMGKIFKMKAVWMDTGHVMAMVNTDLIEFTGNDKEIMMLDGFKDVIHLHRTEPKELYYNEEDTLIWRSCLYDGNYIKSGQKILEGLEHDGHCEYYMPQCPFPMALVGGLFTIFIAPRMINDETGKPKVLEPPEYEDTNFIPEEFA